ncbi:MAG: hypothetical protein ABW004_03500, partial [Aeromicrobium sp.]
MYQRYAVVGAMLVIGHAVLPAGTTRDVLYVVIGVSAVAAILIGLHLHPSAARLPWLVMAAGQTCWVAGDITFGAAATSTVAWSDAFYLAAYPLLAVGMADLIRRRRRRADIGDLIDSVIVTIAVGLLSWVFVADPIVDDTSRTVAARAVAVAYPFGDILLLAAAIRLAVDTGKRQTSFYFLASSVVALLVTDAAYGLALLNGTYDNDVLLDVGWISFYLLWGAAALHPSMAGLESPAPERTPKL